MEAHNFRRTGLAAIVTIAALGFASSSAHAATATWSCGASAAIVTVAGAEPVNPVTASRTPCSDQFVGLPKLTDALGLAPAINAKSAYAITSAKAAGARPIEQATAAASGVEGLSIKSGDSTAIGVDAAESEVTATCKDGNPVFNGTSKIAHLIVGGQVISLDDPLITITNALSDALGALVDVRLNEQVKDANGFIQRAAHIKVLAALGADPLLDIIVAEARLSSSSACDPNADGNKTPGGDVGGASTSRLCPQGSQLDAASGFCIIPASASGGMGIVVIGRPYSGPSGGTVVALNVARKLYKSVCLYGPGEKYAIVGTNKGDRITGTNVRDRILGRAGNDALDGGRGNDCIDGGTGGDTLSGALGNDRAYGLAGKDHLNGGPGNDYLSGGAGNDTISTSFGSDTALGGSGVDFINAATAGRPAKINCGTGADKVRINKNERTRIKGCETVYVFNDK
jgi:Ca2+-binding RTX toxin-like protein